MQCSVFTRPRPTIFNLIHGSSLEVTYDVIQKTDTVDMKKILINMLNKVVNCNLMRFYKKPLQAQMLSDVQ